VSQGAAAALLRLLGDDTRLRLMRVLSKEALNVSELTAILGLAQSGVSRHLGLLRDAGLVVEERAGAFTWYRLAPELAAAGDAPQSPGERVRVKDSSLAPSNDLWRWLRTEFDRPGPATRADDARLEEVRRLRKENFSQHGAGQERRQLVPGRSWAAWGRALGLLLPPMDVADLGCGEGYLTIEAARWAKRVVAVDRSAEVLARARAAAGRRRVSNITWKRGVLEKLPLADGCVDLALLSQALHHADDPARALAEASRILRSGGRVLVLDLREHGEAWVQSTLGDRWLGFDPEAFRGMLADAGFSEVVVRVGSGRPGDPFTVLIAVGTKRVGASPTPHRRRHGGTVRDRH
jgi:SAM-dependent methyltransferase